MSKKKSASPVGKLNPAVESNKPKLDGEAKAIAGRAATASVAGIGSKMGEIRNWNLSPSDEAACKDYLYEQVEAEFGKFLRQS
jgi:hypothetical protein